MIVRLVSLKFEPEYRSEFEALFETAYPKIRRLPGCTFLQLVADPERPADFMTISYWESEEELEEYRASELFGAVWPQVREMLREKPWAKSYRAVAGDSGFTVPLVDS